MKQRAFHYTLQVTLQLIGAVAVLATALAVHATPDRAVAAQIEQLLDRVRQSPCQFERNGDAHSGVGAAKHMATKYQHFRDDITTAEDFIRLAASKSELTGKPYWVLCLGQPPVLSADWFADVLTQLRASVFLVTTAS